MVLIEKSNFNNNCFFQSDGVSETFMLARKYVDQATKDIAFLKDSEYKEALRVLGEMVITRDR